MLIYICVSGIFCYLIVDNVCKDGEDWEERYRVNAPKNCLLITTLLWGWLLLPYALILAIWGLVNKKG